MERVCLNCPYNCQWACSNDYRITDIFIVIAVVWVNSPGYILSSMGRELKKILLDLARLGEASYILQIVMLSSILQKFGDF